MLIVSCCICHCFICVLNLFLCWNMFCLNWNEETNKRESFCVDMLLNTYWNSSDSLICSALIIFETKQIQINFNDFYKEVFNKRNLDFLITELFRKFFLWDLFLVEYFSGFRPWSKFGQSLGKVWATFGQVNARKSQKLTK